MKKLHSYNKKKIRGWKRRIKQIDAWGRQIQNPYLKNFKETGDYTYDRCILYPFYTLEKRQPPLWFYKLMITKLVEAYFEWQKIFEDLKLPYDLQLFLYDPSFMWSEIICRCVDKKGDKTSYAWESDLTKQFPYGKFSNNVSLLKKFDWTFADEELVTFESELAEENLTVSQLLNDGYVQKESDENDFYYAKKIGDLWIGRLKI